MVAPMRPKCRERGYHDVAWVGRSLRRGAAHLEFKTTLMILNAITLGLETSPDVRHSVREVLEIFDRVVISVFDVGILMKLFSYRQGFYAAGGMSLFLSPWA